MLFCTVPYLQDLSVLASLLSGILDSKGRSACLDNRADDLHQWQEVSLHPHEGLSLLDPRSRHSKSQWHWSLRVPSVVSAKDLQKNKIRDNRYATSLNSSLLFMGKSIFYQLIFIIYSRFFHLIIQYYYT